jgi:hypothetical protein
MMTILASLISFEMIVIMIYCKREDGGVSCDYYGRLLYCLVPEGPEEIKLCFIPLVSGAQLMNGFFLLLGMVYFSGERTTLRTRHGLT